MTRAEQPTLELFEDEPVPGSCPDEASVAPIGGGKSYCRQWQRWTNCREVGHCVWDAVGRPQPTDEPTADSDE